MELLRNVVETLSRIGDPGPTGRTLRIAGLAQHVAKQCPNSTLLEIGAGEGATTTHLLRVAKAHNCKVVACDPWEDFTDQPPGYGVYSYDKFAHACRPYSGWLTVYRGQSGDPLFRLALQQHQPISFAFVDGLQYKDSVLHDLYTCNAYNVPVVAVDDYNRATGISQVPAAVNQFLEEVNYAYGLWYFPPNMECYLLKL